MPKYRVTKRSFIANVLVEEGAIVDFEGKPGDNLEPLDAAGQKAVKSASASAAESQERMAQAIAGAQLSE